MKIISEVTARTTVRFRTSSVKRSRTIMDHPTMDSATMSRLGASPGFSHATEPGLAPKRLITIYTPKLANLDELKQSLLQKAFTGQLTSEVLA